MCIRDRMIILQIKDHFYESRIIFTNHGSFLRITDLFCGSRIIFVDHGSFCGSWIVWCSRKIIRKMIRQQNAFDPIHFIRSVIRNPNHFRINNLWSAIWIILGSMIRDPRSGSFFWWSSPLLLLLTHFNIKQNLWVGFYARDAILITQINPQSWQYLS